MNSQALQANLACTRVDVTIDNRYEILLEVMEEYPGAQQGLRKFLEEICHPYRNWEYIVKEARSYGLQYFHVLMHHARGPEAARLYQDIFFQAIQSSSDDQVKRDASDNLLLYLQHILREGESELPRFLPILNNAFEQMTCCPDEDFAWIVKSYYAGNHLARRAVGALPEEQYPGPLLRFLLRYLSHAYTSWLEEGDPLVWFQAELEGFGAEVSLRDILEPVCHETLRGLLGRLEDIKDLSEQDPFTALSQLLSLPGFGDLVDRYRRIPPAMLKAGGNSKGMEWKLMALLYTMNVPGLSAIHEESLRDINRTLAAIALEEDYRVIQRFLDRIFKTLKLVMARFPETALNTVYNIGKGIYGSGESELVDFFLDAAISLGFEAPEVVGMTDEWQVRSNGAHIQNIRTWLGLVELDPSRSKKLVSALIIHLSLRGVLIRDTDLFPRDITHLLNRPLGPVYNLVKQLARLLPTFFSDIGAEGPLRDVSTRMDEICLRKDPLSHFLRKQSHVESSNRIIPLVEAAIGFWKKGSREALLPFLPPAVYDQIEARGPFFEGVHQGMNHLFQQEDLKETQDLLTFPEARVNPILHNVPGVNEQDAERIGLLIRFYKLLDQKYSLGFRDLKTTLGNLRSSGLPDPARLAEALDQEDLHIKIQAVLAYLEALKDIVLSETTFEAREDIYRKRHFAVDIPSMYGSYHETKFEALGLSFRLESLLTPLLEDMVAQMDFNVITRNTFSRILDTLHLLDRALKIDGMASLELERQLDLLTSSLHIRGFSPTQYRDIFQGFSLAVGNLVNDYFNNIHQENLQKILKDLPLEGLIPKYGKKAREDDREGSVHRISEIFLRDQIASSLGLQPLDVFLTRILQTLHNQATRLPKEDLRLLFSYDPEKAVTPMSPVKEGLLDIIHLGNKGLNLVKLKSLDLPVPDGFIITTEVFRCRPVLDQYEPARNDLEEQIARHTEQLAQLTGRRFGSPENTLLLSVRSGASISQPGMMNTFLNVGINPDIVDGITRETGNEWFAWDTYRRFLQSYGMAYGLSRDRFDGIIADFKKRLNVPYKSDFSGEQMHQVALAYQTLIQDSGIRIEKDPYRQLYIAIARVMDSWDSEKAIAYRKIMGISDDWGTAVTVQAMVFGNTSSQSGAGVFFTHNPRWPGDMLVLWGDWTLGNQGEDVVSGLVTTRPVSVRQAELENRDPENALESLFPDIYYAMREWAKELIYEKKWSPQEIEFTFEGPGATDLFFLQTRDMAIRQRKRASSFDLEAQAKARLLAHGIGVSGGAMTGRVVFTLEEIETWRKREPETALILVRGDTVPDDIVEIARADGLLTARGGSTSHAAIVAHRLNKTCVVGCTELICMERDRACSFDDRILKSGEWVSMDGLEGSVYLGRIPIRDSSA